MFAVESTIEALYYGNIRPTEEAVPAECAQANREVNALCNALNKTLNEAQRRQLDECFDASNYAASNESRTLFIRGFRLGARLMLDVLKEDE